MPTFVCRRSCHALVPFVTEPCMFPSYDEYKGSLWVLPVGQRDNLGCCPHRDDSAQSILLDLNQGCSGKEVVEKVGSMAKTPACGPGTDGASLRGAREMPSVCRDVRSGRVQPF